MIRTFVHTLRHEAADVIGIELRSPDGAELPAFTAGAHVDLHLPGGLVRSYSLVNDCRERHRYVLAVNAGNSAPSGERSSIPITSAASWRSV